MQASNPDLVEQLRYDDDDDNNDDDNDDDAQAADAGRTRGAIPATRGRTAPVTSLSRLVRRNILSPASVVMSLILWKNYSQYSIKKFSVVVFSYLLDLTI